VLGSLVESIYGDMCHVAARYLRSEGPAESLLPEGLVNEAFIRLAESETIRPADHGHLMALLCRQMRRILIEHGRQRTHEHEQLLLHGPLPKWTQTPDLTVAVLLERLTAFNERVARVIEFRVWGGFKHQEIAKLLNISKSTVVRDWDLGCSWLLNNLPTINEPRLSEPCYTSDGATEDPRFRR
jgi:RNA polymerase sigma factor (TIGR02999 family)